MEQIVVELLLWVEEVVTLVGPQMTEAYFLTGKEDGYLVSEEDLSGQEQNQVDLYFGA